jgi:hypothetical protein
MERFGWKDYIEDPERKGLHSILQHAVDVEAGKSPYQTPTPEEMYWHICQKHSDVADTVFPSGCLEIVHN